MTMVENWLITFCSTLQLTERFLLMLHALAYIVRHYRDDKYILSFGIDDVHESFSSIIINQKWETVAVCCTIYFFQMINHTKLLYLLKMRNRKVN